MIAKPTLKELEEHGIIRLRELIRKEPGWNPRNLSGYLVCTMDRDECTAYIIDGILPSPESKPHRKATLEAGAQKYFGKGGDGAGIITAPEASESDDAPTGEPDFVYEITPPKKIEQPPTAAPAPGLDALMIALTAAVKADVLASLPPIPKQELDADKVRAIVTDQVAAVTEAYSKATEKAIDKVNAKASESVTQALADVMRALSTATTPQKARASAALKKATGKGTNKIMDRLLSLCPVGNNPANHVLIVGPSGTGKTYQARIFARLHDWHTEAPIGLHKYMEPHHISGSAAPNDDGGFSFVSGAFRDGFLAASQGKTACILLDEVLRASPEMQESLLSILDPIPTPRGLVYRYRSGKPVKTGENGHAQWEQEVIECSVEKLSIVCTANIGSNYGVFAVDEAFLKRFRVIRAERDGADERQIIAEKVTHCGPKAIKAAVILLDESRRAVKSGSLQYPACIRTIGRCGDQAANIAELKQEFFCLLTEELTGWTEDGAILQTHLDQAKQIFAKVESTLAERE